MNIIKNIFARLYVAYALLLFVATILIIFIPVVIVSYFPEPRRAKMLHHVLSAWMFVYMPLVGCPVIVKGKKNFKKGQNYVVIINHNSHADILAAYPAVPGANKTLAKMEMSKIPIFGKVYKTGAILVDRKSEESRRESFKEMKHTLEMGIHLCLYPEGTRNKTDAPLQRFYDGAFITAVAAQKPIIPALVFNTKKIFPADKKFWGAPRPIPIHFLEPVPTEGLSLNDVPALKERIHNIMETYYLAHIKN